MFNVLLVDDEEIVLKGLQAFVDWEAIDYKVVASVTSVDEAVIWLDHNDVDVILTDVKMPDKTGLDLLEIVSAQYETVELVILSGYGEFEYAQKAMRLGALGYLTKPVNFDELKAIFTDIHLLLSNRNEKKHQEKKYLDVQKNRYFSNLLKGLISEINDEELKTPHFHIEEGQLIVIRIKLHIGIQDWYDYNEKKSMITDFVHNLLRDKYNYQIVDTEVKELSVILYKEESMKDLKNLFEHLADIINKNLQVQITIGFGNAVDGVLLLEESYIQAGKAMQYSRLKRSNAVAFEEIDENIYIEELFNDEMRAQVLKYLSLSQENKLIDYLTHIYDLMIEEGIRRNAVYAFSVELFTIMGDYYLNFAEGEPLNKRINSCIKELILQDSLSDIKDNVLGNIHNVIHEFDQVEEVAHDSVGIAKQYIKEHYAEDLRLSKVAEVLFIHPIYLSRLFKEKSGENYLEFVTRIRMEKAKELLKDLSYKIYHVSDLVGYESPRYFSKIFKTTTGMTPKEFREKNGNIVL